MYRLLNLKVNSGQLTWYVQDIHDNTFSWTTKLPFKDYFFATEDQTELLKLVYPKTQFVITPMGDDHVFEKFEYKDKQVFKVEAPHPYLKGKYCTKIEELYNELLFETDISYKDLVMKDLDISEFIDIVDGVPKGISVPENFPTIKEVIIDFETDDRNKILDSSEKYINDFAKPDVSRILSMSALIPETGEILHFTNDDEEILLKDIKDFLYKFHRIRAWNGNRFDFIVFNRWAEIGVSFNKDRFQLIDDQVIHEMMNRKESWYVSLDQVALRYLNERKIKHKWSFYDAFLNHKDELKIYNNRDVELMHKLEQKFKFNSIIFNIATNPLVGLLPQDIRYARKPSIQAIMRMSMNHYGKRVVWKSKSIVPNTKKYKGSIVIKAIAGRHKNVLGIDLLSIYNNIMQTWNISPEAYYKDPPNPLADRYYNYDRFEHEGIIPRVLRIFEKERNVYRDLKNTTTGELHNTYDLVQQGLKIVLLAIYGGVGARGSTSSKHSGGKPSGAKSFYHWECASDTTGFGREILVLVQEVIISFGFQIAYGDTDSIYFSLEDKDYNLDEIKQIMDMIVQAVNENAESLLDKYNIPKERRKIKIEAQGWYSPFVLFDKKKNYFARERYNAENDVLHPDDHYEVYAKGVKMSKTSEPIFIRKFQKELYRMALAYETRSKVRTYISQTKKKFFDGEFDDELIFETKIKDYLSNYKENDVDSPAIRLANELKMQNKFQEKSTIFYIIWAVGLDGKPIAKSEGTKMTREGRIYVWDHRIQGWIDELLDFVYPTQTSLLTNEAVVGTLKKDKREPEKDKKIIENTSLDQWF